MKTFRLYGVRILVALLLTLAAYNASGSSGSEAGATWTLRTSQDNSLSLRGVTYGNGLFVAVGDDLTILTSPDGANWTKRISVRKGIPIEQGNLNTPISPWSFFDVTYGNGTFVAVGALSTTFTSPDGVHWTGTLGTRINLSSVAYGKGTFVAVGVDGTIRISPDGVSWAQGISIYPTFGVTYGNGTFVAVGDKGTILTSPNGVHWTERTAPTSNDLRGAGYGNGTFVVVGKGGTILTSPDGANWTARVSGTSNSLYSVAYGNGTFVVVGDKGTILTSPDGVNWTVRTSGTSNSLYSVAYGNGTFVVVGDKGTILTSP